MPEAARSFAHVFARAPALLDGVPAPDADVLKREVTVTVEIVEPGPWRPPPQLRKPLLFGLLALDGALMCRTALGEDEIEVVELVGPGDVFRVDRENWAIGPLSRAASWSAPGRCRIAVLDHDFQVLTSSWPTIGMALLRRMTEQNNVRLQIAITRIRSVETRVLVLLWHLSDRFGGRGSGAKLMPLALPDELLAELAAIDRQSFQGAVDALVRKQRISRRSDGGWLLFGPPPGRAGQLGIRQSFN